MEKIEKTLRYNNLINAYGALLSSTQKEILSSYFEYDLSISEIANERGISRAAVEDALKKGTANLEDLENKLGLLKKYEEILEITSEMKENSANPKLNKKIEKIERKLK